MLRKQIFAFTLIIATLFAAAPSAWAAQPNVTRTATAMQMDLSRDPRFTYINSIASGLSINSLGRASCSGTFNPYNKVDSTITMTLQQDKDGTWTDIKSWSADNNANKPVMIDKGYYVEKGYRYRVVTVVQIWDTDGTELEKVSCDSPISEY